MSNPSIDNFITLLINDSLQLPKFLLQLKPSDMETAAASIKKMENLAEKILYVKAHHTHKITEMQPNGNWKSVWYKTYIYVDGKRKAVEATTEEKVYDKLYELLKKDITLEQAFEMLMEYKLSCLHRDDHTIQTDRGNFAHVSKKIRETKINELTDESIQRFIVSDFLPEYPSKNLFKRVFELIDQVFKYGIRKKICRENPMIYLSKEDYYHFCNITIKSNEETVFSEKDVDIIREDAQDKMDNPRVIMSLIEPEINTRTGELPAVHKEDVDLENGYIHIHRQQKRQGKELVEVQYTKNERLHPQNGRKIPLTDEAKRLIKLALEIPGDSEYLFHDPYSSEWIKKDSYAQNLRRRCKKLGCKPKCNTAFRKYYNTNLYQKGIKSSIDRALLMGHEPETNSRFYSVTNDNRLEELKNIINKKEP